MTTTFTATNADNESATYETFEGAEGWGVYPASDNTADNVLDAYCDDEDDAIQAMRDEGLTLNIDEIPDDLDGLLIAMREGWPSIKNWDSLPTYGGVDPDDTHGVWSWDASRLIVGSCADDVEIVDR